ncbi:MAG: hypothetical protein KA004_11110 [Verrucomicrobiales bacterium]|nr:hypothetical protein [Verrucomicrobiales bacterium]
MKCPRCVREVAPGAANCGECGFSIADLNAHFGAEPVVLDRVHDAAGIFQPPEVESLTNALTEFEAQFPQLFLCIHAGALPAGTGPRQFGFWLLNHAAVNAVAITRPNENGALLVLDAASGQAALVVGYFLECHLNREDLQACLNAARNSWQHGRFAAGALQVVGEFSNRLRRAATSAAAGPEQPAGARTATEPTPSGLSAAKPGAGGKPWLKGERKSPYKKKGKRR